MEQIPNFEDFSNELNEETIKGYKYHFTFEDNDYTIHQGKKDKTIFGVKDKDGGWKAMTKGKLFDSSKNDMETSEMIQFIQRGIKYFNVRNPVEQKDVRESEWSKFFRFELKHKPGRLTKKYVILKLHCGKASCKWLSKNK